MPRVKKSNDNLNKEKLEYYSSLQDSDEGCYKCHGLSVDENEPTVCESCQGYDEQDADMMFALVLSNR